MTSATMTVDQSGTWSVFVDGCAVVTGESYQVASNILHALTYPEPETECGEVAASIAGRI